jgi:hypothetical protein
MATAKKTTTRKASIKMDSKLVYAFDGLIRDGLIAASALSKAEDSSLTLSSKKVMVEINTKTARQIFKMLRKGLIASSAVSKAEDAPLKAK